MVGPRSLQITNDRGYESKATYVHCTQNVLRYSRKQQRVLRRPAFPPVLSRFQVIEVASCSVVPLSLVLCLASSLRSNPGPPIPKMRTNVRQPGLSSKQKDVYRNVLLRDIDMVNGTGGGGNAGRTVILNIVMQLRKCCNHPYLFAGVEDRKLDPLGDHLIINCGKARVGLGFFCCQGVLDVEFIDIFFWLELSRNVETVEGWARADGKGVWGEGLGGFFADMYSRLYVYCGLLVLWSRSTCCHLGSTYLGCTRNASQPASPV